MAWSSNAQEVTILGRHFESFDEICRDFELSQSSARNRAVKQLGKGASVEEITKLKNEIMMADAEEKIRLYNMRQDFALGKYSRRDICNGHTAG